MRTTTSIRYRDVQAVLQLVNELHEMRADPLAQKRHLLQCLCRILGAKVGAIVLLSDGSGPQWQFRSPEVIDYGWSCPKERASLLAYRDEMLRNPAELADPMESMLGIAGRVVTRRREQLHGDSFWYARGHINEYRRPARVDDCVYTLHRLPAQGCMVGLGMHREWGDRARIGRRETDVLHLVSENLQFVWAQDVTEDPRERLSPRLRQTLTLLLGRQSEKQIAKELGISRNTLHKYVTALYRHFAVSSRAELMARHIKATLSDCREDERHLHSGQR